MNDNFLGHTDSCPCKICQVMAVFANRTGEIEASEALETLIPLCAAFLSTLSHELSTDVIMHLVQSTREMRAVPSPAAALPAINH